MRTEQRVDGLACFTAASASTNSRDRNRYRYRYHGGGGCGSVGDTDSRSYSPLRPIRIDVREQQILLSLGLGGGGNHGGSVSDATIDTIGTIGTSISDSRLARGGGSVGVTFGCATRHDE
jgi:hypothetical protein